MSSEEEKIQEQINKLLSTSSSDECLQVSKSIAHYILNEAGMGALYSLFPFIEESAMNKKSGVERESSMILVLGLCQEMKHAVIPYVVPILPIILELAADKGQVVREAAELALEEIGNLISNYSIRKVFLPIFLEGMKGSAKWQTKVACLRMIAKFIRENPSFMMMEMAKTLPAVCACLNETKAEVVQVANDTLSRVSGLVNNRDVEHILADMFRCLARPSEVPQCIEKISNTTFVSEVTGPLLAILVPLLDRGLQDRSSVVTRQAIKIVGNLSKLVRNPEDAQEYLSTLYENLNYLCENAAFPEIREMAVESREWLMKAGGGITIEKKLEQVTIEDKEQAEWKSCQEVLVTYMANYKGEKDELLVSYVASLCLELIQLPNFQMSEWKNAIIPYLAPHMKETDAETVSEIMRKFYMAKHHKLNYKEEEEMNADSSFDTPRLCSCDFSLAYGGRMLLNFTRLRLHRGQRYGLCGHNGCGKTTLMRSIAAGKVEGFPSQEEVSTVFVEHSLQGEETELPVVDFVAAHERLASVPREKIETILKEFGFTPELLSKAVMQLSGGWKMKLELARAMLMNADILLLDEPTNHLDEANVRWLENYLNRLTDVTCLIVSHDSGFLDNVCTCIIHYQNKKLKYYKGNLSQFVERYPPAKSYYTLDNAVVKFSFPPPGLLTGVKSNTKAILKLSNVSFSYKGSKQTQISNVSVNISLSSRVGIVGQNGAGKSTMIKLMTGEVAPTQGTVWKHPNLRIGYVAQHAFHHLEQHVDSTPAGYLRWRYQGGEDREVLEKETRKFTEEDKALLAKPITVDGQERWMEFLCGRQKLKKSYTYEIKWKNMEHRWNTWVPREVLLENGFQRFVQAFDDHIASREGLSFRELNPKAIREHYQSVGLDPEIAEHSKIAQLSGGQKVKVVIGSAMWNNPHLLVLDEPTNFLDRDSLAGLSAAIQDWGGAVVMISHNAEFISTLCPEIWKMEAGVLTIEGAPVNCDEENDSAAPQSDAALTKPKKKKKLTRNELKAQQIRRRQRHLKWLNEGGVKEPDTDSD